MNCDEVIINKKNSFYYLFQRKSNPNFKIVCIVNQNHKKPRY